MECGTDSPLFLSTEFDGGNDLSTGYLEDALVGFTIRFKRRRVDSPCYSFGDYEGVESMAEGLSEECSLLNELAAAVLGVEGGENAEFYHEEMRTMHQSTDAAAPELDSSSCSSSSKVDFVRTTKCDSGLLSNGSSSLIVKRAGEVKEMATTRVTTRPFGLVKPGGIDGGITLKDINRRILRPPTRPIKHPVGEYASRPWVTPDGPGLSGKAVVALIRIHTRGSGTITIIRTKG